MDDYLIYAKTVHSYEITKLFDVLKEILNDVKIDFLRDPNQGEFKKKSKKNESNSESDNSSDSESTSSSDSESESEEDTKKKPTKKNPTKKNTTKKNKKEESDSEPEQDDKLNKNKNDPPGDEANQDNKAKQKKRSTGGIRMIALDHHKTLLIYAKLYADEFTDFYVKPASYSIGIDLITLHKFMKTVDKDSVMTIRLDKDDEQYIKFELENNVKNNTAVYQQKVLDIDDDPKKIPPDTSFEMSVVMDTSDFRKICSEFSQFAEFVEITCTSKTITFRCHGDSNAFVKTFKNSTEGVKIMSMNKDGKKGLGMVQAIYNLKHLVTFGKCVNLCDEMQLFLKNDYPLFIHYTIGNIGKLLVGLSPVDEKTIKRDADYNEENDKYYTQKKAIIKEM